MILTPLLFALVVAPGLQQTAPPPPPPSAEEIKAPPPRTQDPTVPPAPVVPGPTETETNVPNTPLTADEAARIALKLQPSLINARSAIEIAQGRTQQVRAAQNPQVIVGAGYDTVQSISGTSTTALQAPTGISPAGVSASAAYSGVVAVRQLLYDFNQTRNQVRQNRALEGTATNNLTRAQQDLIQTVKNAFYNYANAQRLVDVNEQNVANRQRQLDLANARFSHGLGLPIDVVTAETSKSQGIVALTTARDTAEQARIALLQAMGVNPLTPIVTADSVEKPIPNPDPKALLTEGLHSRPEILAATQSLNASKYGLNAAKSLNMPSLYATVAAGSSGNQFVPKTSVSSLGIGVQFPLEDGGQRSGAVKSARGQLSSSEADLQSAILNVQSDITGAYMALTAAEQRVTVADIEVTNAREGVRIAEGRYAAGLGLFLDITNAQALLLTALTDQTSARNTLDLARTRLRHAIGNTLSDSATTP